MEEERRRKYWHWLCSIEKLPPVKKIRLLRFMPDPEELYNIEEKTLAGEDILTPKERRLFLASRDNRDSLWRSYDRMVQKGIRLVTLEDPDYPWRLLHIYDPPCGLYVKGQLPAPREKSAAIVGARQCSHYGREMARQTGRILAAAGVQVISGMALGIDRAGHEGALEMGATFAVLGCGADQCYPADNYDLYRSISEKGGILSEFPPGSRPEAWHFPQRNRLISGLSDLVAVIEARKKSGSLITAECAMDQGKDVFALPGMVTDPLSEGCHRLIQNGAGLLSAPEDLLEILVPNHKIRLKSSKEIEMGLVFVEKKVYSGLDFRPKSLEEIAGQTGLPVREAAQALVQLELKGLIRRTEWNYYAVSFPAQDSISQE